jgi:hypothetical protein
MANSQSQGQKTRLLSFRFKRLKRRGDLSEIELNTDNTDLTDRHGLKLQVFQNKENHE